VDIVGLISVMVMAVLAAGPGDTVPQPEPFKVIVNAARRGQAVDRTALVQIYLGAADRWADGKPIVPVDLSATSPVRAAFSRAVLDMPIERVQMHWMKSMSQGRTPPKTKTSDDEVIAFVSGEPGAVGYVSTSAALPDTVRVLSVQTGP
jgi:ABC-type phosphate transport system substrate-binding protein